MMCGAEERVCSEKVMKIPLVARPKRQNASVRGLALSFPPLQARLWRKFPENTRANATFALCPDLA
eukprot:5408612-Pleurochrysis_carterae.AAC.1